MSLSSISAHLPTSSRIELKNLFQPEQWENDILWESFREGVEIHRLYGDGLAGPSATLIRYQPGTAVPLHCHSGYEHVLILAGSQKDHEGVYGAGTLIVNPPGSRHRIVSDHGCIVLVIYEKPVQFV